MRFGMSEETLSKGKVDRAGATLRAFAAARGLYDEAVVDEARRIVGTYRTAHSYALTKTSVGLRQFIQTEEGRGDRTVQAIPPAQRLKRIPAIVAKLGRGTMRLSQMEDVAGCRAVLSDRDALARVAERIRRNWEIEGEDDYFAKPKPDGYRALHMRARRDDYRIEIQLRTPSTHAWAEIVDQLTLAMSPRFDVKHGVAPADLLTDLERLADTLEELELGTIRPTEAVTSELKVLVDRIFRAPAEVKGRA
jgi:putative GTP pyrophosphokinase